MVQTLNQSGVLVIHARVECPADSRFHARVSFSQGPNLQGQSLGTVATIEELCEVVRSWATELVCDAEPASEDPRD
jgi:hypothetical protein